MFLIGEEVFILSVIDRFMIGIAIVSFVVFLMLLILVFRLVERKEVLKWLVYVFCMALIVNLGLTGWFMLQQNVLFTMGVAAILTILILPVVLYSLMSFCYVLCIFGAYESSVRLRIVRELDEAGTEGLSWEDILKRYNDDTILKIRLGRLVASKELSFDGTHYRLERKYNAFSFITLLSRIIKKFYGL